MDFNHTDFYPPQELLDSPYTIEWWLIAPNNWYFEAVDSKGKLFVRGHGLSIKSACDDFLEKYRLAMSGHTASHEASK